MVQAMANFGPSYSLSLHKAIRDPLLQAAKSKVDKNVYFFTNKRLGKRSRASESLAEWDKEWVKEGGRSSECACRRVVVIWCCFMWCGSRIRNLSRCHGLLCTLLWCVVDPYVIVCIYCSCASGCNQELVRAIESCKLFRDIAGLLML